VFFDTSYTLPSHSQLMRLRQAPCPNCQQNDGRVKVVMHFKGSLLNK